MKALIISHGVVGNFVSRDGEPAVDRYQTITLRLPSKLLSPGMDELIGKEVLISLIDPERCEHLVPDGEWCEPCNREHKRARVAAGDDDDVNALRAELHRETERWNRMSGDVDRAHYSQEDIEHQRGVVEGLRRRLDEILEAMGARGDSGRGR